MRWKSGSFEYEYPSGIKPSSMILISESRVIPGVYPEEAWEDQELGPGDAHPQQQDLDEDERGMSPARCEDLTGDYACHECCQDEIKEWALIEFWSKIDERTLRV
jgi:hypothetical protein